MKYALVIVELWSIEIGDTPQLLTNFLGTVRQRLGASDSTKILNPGAFLCNLQNGMRDVANLVAAAEERGYVSRTLFFDQDPPFVISKAKKAP